MLQCKPDHVCTNPRQEHQALAPNSGLCRLQGLGSCSDMGCAANAHAAARAPQAADASSRRGALWSCAVGIRAQDGSCGSAGATSSRRQLPRGALCSAAAIGPGHAAVTASQAASAWLAKKRTSVSASSASSSRQGRMARSATAASTSGTRRSSILATLNLMLGTCAGACGEGAHVAWMLEQGSGACCLQHGYHRMHQQHQAVQHPGQSLACAK